MYYDIIQSVMDAAGACRMIQEFTAGYTLETYQRDLRTRSAVERQFEILGEALNRAEDADPAFRDSLPEMGNIIGMRNRLAHGYDRVSDAVIWDAAKTDVPDLQSKLTVWLEKNG
jgi:uncharacterized protein with HEPN domain